MSKEKQPDLFPRPELPEEEIANEPSVPPEISKKIQEERNTRHDLKKKTPEEFAKLRAKLGLDNPGPIFEKEKRQN